jgi:hypothetical protein
MNKTALPLIIGLAVLTVLTGCAHTYVMRLTNGAEITTASKPRLKDGVYYFNDAKGQEHTVAAARVREVAPASMAAREDKPQPVQGGAPKKRKWYLLWLG